MKKTRKLCIEVLKIGLEKSMKIFLVLRAFTSQMVIDKLKKRDNYLVDNPKEALEKMKDNNIENIYIQPLHIIPGHEYEKLLEQAYKFSKGNDSINIQIGKPLLFL